VGSHLGTSQKFVVAVPRALRPFLAGILRIKKRGNRVGERKAEGHLETVRLH
jgi:hypothetical protein